MPFVKSGIVISSVSPFPPGLTHGQGLVALYMLQDWESFAPGKMGEPYAPTYFYTHIHGALNGLANPTRKTAMGHMGHSVCLVCGIPVDLTRTVGDHLIARAYGGPETIQNAIILCRSHNSSKGTKDLLEWWLLKGYPVEQLPRSVLCLYARMHWQLWGMQVHHEPLRSWMGVFLQQRAAALPSDEHRVALYGAAFAACGLAPWLSCGTDLLQVVPHEAMAGPYLSEYGMALVGVVSH